MTIISTEARTLAAALVARFQDVSIIDQGSGELQHAVLSEGATDQYFDENTGGFIWLSHSLHRAEDGTMLHLEAGADTCSVYLAKSDTAMKCADTVAEMCGETANIDVASGEYAFPEDVEGKEAALCELYGRFLKRHSLPEICCLELQMGHELTPHQRAWAEAFSKAWDVAIHGGD